MQTSVLIRQSAAKGTTHIVIHTAVVIAAAAIVGAALGAACDVETLSA